MLLSAALIVRDESAVLADCLGSIRHVVDEIVIVDTGSVDDSRKIAARYGSRVIEHPWNGDFAQARNLGLEAAHGDWILYIDADEQLAPTDRANVQQLLSGADEAAFRLLLKPDSRSTPYFEYRIWRHDPRIRFEGQIHEKVTPSIAFVAAADNRPVTDCDLLLTHVGYEGDQTHKHERNLPLLRAELARDPNNLFNRHHLSRVLHGLGQTQEAEAVLVDAVELARRRPADELGILVLVDLIRLRRAQGRDISGLLAEGRGRYPANKLLWWLQAAWHLSKHRYEEALERLDLLLAVDLATLPAEGPGYDARIFGEFAHEARGVCLFRLGRYEEAMRSFENAAQLDPENIAYRAKWLAARGRVRGPVTA